MKLRRPLGTARQTGCVVAIVLLTLCCERAYFSGATGTGFPATASAQAPQRNPRNGRQRAAAGAANNPAGGENANAPPGGPGQPEAPPAVELPSDPRLLALHRDFVTKAEKLAGEYERTADIGKARDVYVQILKLVPNYPPAVKKLDEIRQREATADRRVLDVQADGGWQPTGVFVEPGRPVRIKAAGEWTFRMVHRLSADGMQIPEELRDFNLGALVGMIATEDPEKAKPFLVGSQYEFVAELPGQLLLRMYDSDPSDNQGRLNVEITGTFSKR
ncbi:MAG: hypothetical protein K1X74_14250 [Pirellulales bacterium]|nr:hypothetical protein [Pirellulales bacterium]